MDLPPAALWGVSSTLAPLPGGHRNRAFRTVGLAADLVFKSSRRAPEAVEWLIPVQRLAEEAGLVVPSPVRSTNGRLLERGWTCEPFIPGSPFGPDDLPAIRPELERFHALARGMAQRPGFLAAEDLLECDVGGDVDLGALPAEVAAACRAAWRAIRGLERSAVHGDVNPANLIRCEDGRAALLDWDETRVDATVFDLGQVGPIEPRERRALLAFEVACSWRIEPAHGRAVLEQLVSGAASACHPGDGGPRRPGTSRGDPA